MHACMTGSTLTPWCLQTGIRWLDILDPWWLQTPWSLVAVPRVWHQIRGRSVGMWGLRFPDTQLLVDSVCEVRMLSGTPKPSSLPWKCNGEMCSAGTKIHVHFHATRRLQIIGTPFTF